MIVAVPVAAAIGVLMRFARALRQSRSVPGPAPRTRRVSGQPPLDLPSIRAAPRYGEEDFLARPPTPQALAMLAAWPDWPDRMLLLIGPEAPERAISGRSGRRAPGRARAPPICHPDAASANASARDIAVEDADSARGRSGLFHLFNLGAGIARFLL